MVIEQESAGAATPIEARSTVDEPRSEPIDEDIHCGVERCLAKFPSTQQGKMSRAHHIRIQHKHGLDDSHLQPSEEDDQEPLGEAPQTQLLHQALTRAVTAKCQAGLLKSICDTFQMNYGVLGTDRHKFRSWVTRYGLGPQAVNVAEDALFGIEGFETSQPGQPQQTVQWVNGPGGQPM